jgi:tRNA pseudouridine55 synthase
MSATSGLVIVDKAAGMTSHDVVARVRRLAGTRKVGHAGTLDPMATGVLVLGLNRATRFLGHLMLTEKAYDATVRLGVSTTTDDAEGEVTSTASAAFHQPGLVEAEFGELVGEIMQVPTAVSAIKVDGKRAYQRVRDGEEVELKPRPVTIHSLHVLDQRVVGDWLDVDISVRCSSGTYIRAIARDVGAALGVGGHLTALRRTAVGRFDLAQAHSLEELADDLTIVPIADAARATFPGVDLDEEQAADVRVGRPLDLLLPGSGEHALFAPGGEFLALYEPTTDKDRTGARPVAVFVG